MIEKPELPEAASAQALARQTRRDFLAFGAGILASLAGAWWLLPDRTKARLRGPSPLAHDPLDTRAGRRARESLLNRALTFDDDVAEALYSKSRRVRTYAKSETTPLRPNNVGLAPLPQALDGWTLTIEGLDRGNSATLDPGTLGRLPKREQVTRLVCVEGWSAIAWWGGIAFADLLRAFPPAPGARWAALRSEISRDRQGNIQPYFVSLDLATAAHPQTLLATELSGRPLPLSHGAPLRLVTPVKLGLKNIKSITHITYTTEEPPDFWALRGYSKYDGL